VNRTAEKADAPFSVEGLRTAQAYGEIYATAMKLHRKIEFSTSVARLEVVEHASQFGVAGIPEPSEETLAALRYRLPGLLAERAADLPERERELLYRIGELIGEYAGIGGGETVAYDL